MLDNGTNFGSFSPLSYGLSSDCGDLLYRIYDNWDSDKTNLTGNASCSAAVGKFYDPTISCAPDSDSKYCTDGIYLCNDTSYLYQCDYWGSESRFSCAPGDLSGKFALLDSSALLAVIAEIDPFMIDLRLLDGLSLVLQCENTYEMITCGAFMEFSAGDIDSIPSTSTSTTTPTDVKVIF